MGTPKGFYTDSKVNSMGNVKGFDKDFARDSTGF